MIKVERLDGGDFARDYDTAAAGLASHFVWCNRGKESIALDLKDPRGLDVVHRLVADADVFVQNLAQGAAARLGLDAAALCAAHPRLVAVDILGYGASGPYAGKRAYDMLVQCEAGLVSVTGTPEQPVKAGIPAADIVAAMYAFSGVLAALVRRGTTGRGGPVEVSMLEALAEWMGHPLHHVMHGGTPPARTGLAHAVIAPYDACPTADGGRVLLSVQNDREWRRLAQQVLGQPELADDPAYATNPARDANRARTDALVAKALGALGADEAVTALESGHRVRTPEGRTRGRGTSAAGGQGPVAGSRLTGSSVAGVAAADHAAGRGGGAHGGGTPARGAHRSGAAGVGDDGRGCQGVAAGRRGSVRSRARAPRAQAGFRRR